MKWAVLLMFLWAVGAQAACRPTGIDLTDRLSDGSYLEYGPMSSTPRTLSNQERDCYEWTLLDYIGILKTLAGDLAPNAARKTVDCFNLVNTRIGVVDPYEGSMQKPAGADWVVPGFGRHYQCEQKSIASYRYELTSSSKRAAATIRFQAHPDLRNLLDVNSTFSGRGSFVLPTPTIIPNRDNTFIVTTKIKYPICGNGDCSGVHGTHQAHKCVTEAKCGLRPLSDCGSVEAAHRAYEDGCGTDERCHMFRRMKRFHGTEDTISWGRTQLCQLAKLQDREHVLWMNGQIAGDLKASRKHDQNHNMLHRGANDGDTRLLYVFMCDVAYNQFGTCFGGKQTMQSLLPKLVAAFGIH